MAEVDEQLKVAVGKMRIDAVLDLLDDVTDHQLPRDRLKALSHMLVDLLNSIFLSQHTFTAELPPIKYAQNLADMLIDALVNTIDRQSSDALQPLYIKLAKRTR